MPVSIRSWPWLAAMLLAGCSASRYEADYTKRVETYEAEAPFAFLQRNPELVEGAASLRLPPDFAVVPKREQRDDVAGGFVEAATDPSRLRPPFLNQFPGYKETFERRLTVDNAEYPVSVAIGVVPGDMKQVGAIEQEILRQVGGNDAFKDGNHAWESRDVLPIAGGPAAWRVLSLSGPQGFEGVVATMVEFKTLPGRCDIWLSADPEQDRAIIIVWRLPDSLAGSLGPPVSSLGQLVARTVAIPLEEPEQAGAAEDAGDPPPGDGDGV